MQYNNSLNGPQFADTEVERQRERIEADIECLINLLDQLDVRFEDMEDDGHSEPDGNTEAIMTTDGWGS
ncbi:MAG: hypothetical protein AAFX02_00535 [Pseudomonadota bacterium]